MRSVITISYVNDEAVGSTDAGAWPGVACLNVLRRGIMETSTSSKFDPGPGLLCDSRLCASCGLDQETLPWKAFGLTLVSSRGVRKQPCGSFTKKRLYKKTSTIELVACCQRKVCMRWVMA